MHDWLMSLLEKWVKDNQVESISVTNEDTTYVTFFDRQSEKVTPIATPPELRTD